MATAADKFVHLNYCQFKHSNYFNQGNTAGVDRYRTIVARDAMFSLALTAPPPEAPPLRLQPALHPCRR